MTGKDVRAGYARCVDALKRAGVLRLRGKSQGVMGFDGRAYPLPTEEQVQGLFLRNRKLVRAKAAQGFDRLELTPMAAPMPFLVDRLQAAIVRHAADREIFQTRADPSDPSVPVRVGSEKQVWIWDTLRGVLESEQLVYFPREHSGNHGGQGKRSVVDDGSVCAFAGWSIRLVESAARMPGPGRARTVGGRRQLEIGLSPRDYLRRLQTGPYAWETGKTLEDFVTEFLTRLETWSEVSNDRRDDNALWCLGQYVERLPEVRSDLVPTGWWHRDFGRVRLDAHRPGNRVCTRSWGAASTVRLPG